MSIKYQHFFRYSIITHKNSSAQEHSKDCCFCCDFLYINIETLGTGMGREIYKKYQRNVYIKVYNINLKTSSLVYFITLLTFESMFEEKEIICIYYVILLVVMERRQRRERSTRTKKYNKNSKN